MRAFVAAVWICVLASGCNGKPSVTPPVEEQTGLWHALDEEKQMTVFFLTFDGQKHQFYSPSWVPLRTEAQPGGEENQLRLRSGAIRGIVTLNFQEGVFSGTITNPHPQAPMKFSWKARRVTPDPKWQPWTFFQPGGTVNCLAPIAEHGAFESEARFVEFFQERVEPLCYPLLTQAIFTDRGLGVADFSERQRALALSKLYAEVENRGSEIGSLLARFEQMVAEVSSDLQKLYPWLEVSGMIVPTFSFGEYDYQPLLFQAKGERPKWFLLMAVDWISEHLTETQSRFLIAQGLLTLRHLSRHGIRDTTLRAEVAQRGIASLLASKLEYSNDPVDFLYQEKKSEAEQMEDFRIFAGKFRRHIKDKTWRVKPDFFLSEMRPSSYRFAYGLALDLTHYYQPRQMIDAFRYEQLNADLASYMRSLRELPPVTS